MTVQIFANVDVDDLAKAVDFYCGVLGLRVGRRFGSKIVELLGGSCALHLLENPPGSSASSGSAQLRDYSRHWTPVHLDFVVPEIAPAIERAQTAGARLEGEVRTYTWGHIAALADPFGNGLCLIEFIGSGYDEIAQPEPSAVREESP